jgi:RNA polymerase sigma factor (sigma-70 family)
MQQIATVDLLTREEEIALAKRIEDGLHQSAGAIAACPMTVTEVLHKVQRIEAKEMRWTDLVIDVVDSRSVDQSAPMPQQGQQSNIDETSGAAIGKERSGLDPEAAKARFARIAELHKRLVRTLHAHGIGSTQASKIRAALPDEPARRMEMPAEKMRHMLEAAQHPISLDTPVGEDEGAQLHDFIEDKNLPAPLDAAMRSGLITRVQELLDTLEPKEAKVLAMRFGIGMKAEHTLEEVGRQFGVTRERIRQIEARALNKLRQPDRSEHLRAFLEN